MVRNYKPTGRPRGRPRKTVITPKILIQGKDNAAPIEPQAIIPPQPLSEDGGKSSVPETPRHSILPAKFEKNSNDYNEVDAALMSRGKILRKLIQRILPEHCLRERARYQKVIEMTAYGIPWKIISAKTQTGWIEMTCLNRKPEFRAIWHSARDAGEDLRKEIRLSEAHRKAVDGWKEPVYFQGKKCGSVQRFDSRLHELLLKADDPVKFSDHAEVKHTGTGAEAGGITVNFIGVKFGEQPKPRDYSLPQKPGITPVSTQRPSADRQPQAKPEVDETW